MFKYSGNEREFDSIEVDSHWNFGYKKECKMHKIHSYPAKFPAFITEKSIEYAQKSGRKIERIADLFCGCGTVAYESSANNIDFWGYDINPVASLIARVKTRKLTEKVINEYYDAIIRQFTFNKNPAKFEFNEINDRILYWFDEQNVVELYFLKKAIYHIVKEDYEYLEFFICAFSNILKKTSRWLSRSIKPTIDKNKKREDVEQSFRKQFEMMRKANRESKISNESSVSIETKSSLKISSFGNKVDLIVTSPPYVTSYEYADLHQLSLLWLDYAEDYRDFRKGTIGSSFRDENKDFDELNEIGKSIVSPFLSLDKRKAKSMIGYYLDMQKITKICFDMLDKNGMAVFVIGNTEYKKIPIRNAEHLACSLSEIGFGDIRITKRKISNKILSPYRDKEGKFSSLKTDRKIYSEEYIVVASK